MRYSNIVPPQDSRAGEPSILVRGRSSENQWVTGTSPLAMATKLARRASEARRS